jgi:hypothetical protein
MDSLDALAVKFVESFADFSGLRNAPYEILDRSDGPYLILMVAYTTERLFKCLQTTNDNLTDSSPFYNRVTLKQLKPVPSDRLSLPESRLLRAKLAESLTVDRYSFEQGDFADRYIRSVFGHEEEVSANGNHAVYGRRGSGKSSLMAYAMHQRKIKGLPYAWLAMQAYEGRQDQQVIADVLGEVLRQLSLPNDLATELEYLTGKLEELGSASRISMKAVDILIPKIRRVLESMSSNSGSIAIFLDDIHVIHKTLQPQLLSKIYSISRGNRVFIKLSGIEQFAFLWDPSTRQGLESPHDIQVLRLDYNLTMPEKSMDHIKSILDAYAQFSGLSNIDCLCGDGVLARLVWVAAGVPRDALNLFSQAMTRATVKGQKRVSITSVNAAASEMAEDKLKNLETDATTESGLIKDTLSKVRNFCVKQEKQNAFLVEIKNDNPEFVTIEKLVALRLLHVLHEGITPREAGRRYKALMLDYGFYVGIRAAKSVELFKKVPEALAAKDLRGLPSYPLG